jgi:hypothetical protein
MLEKELFGTVFQIKDGSSSPATMHVLFKKQMSKVMLDEWGKGYI